MLITEKLAVSSKNIQIPVVEQFSSGVFYVSPDLEVPSLDLSMSDKHLLNSTLIINMKKSSSPPCPTSSMLVGGTMVIAWLHPPMATAYSGQLD